MEPKQINHLLDKYWAGESSLEEEKTLRTYFSSSDVDPSLVKYIALFDYFNQESETSLSKDPSDYIKTETKVISLSSRMKAVAAAAVILFAAIFAFQHLNSEFNNPKTIVLADEIANPDEAYEITKEALAYLSGNYKKGAEPLKVIPKSIESTRIFK